MLWTKKNEKNAIGWFKNRIRMSLSERIKIKNFALFDL